VRSYHGSIGAEHAVLSHTYNPGAIWEVRIDGEVVGESGINALLDDNELPTCCGSRHSF
jgi:D-amino peptidase